MKYLESYNKDITEVKVFGYQVIKELPISELENFKDHRRLKVFYHKGTKCVDCGKQGTKIVYGKARNGSIHKDIVTDNYYPLTIDHIIPRSKGGSDDLSNLQPMPGEEKNKRTKLSKNQLRKASSNIEIGDIVYKKSTGEKLGEVIDIVES